MHGFCRAVVPPCTYLLPSWQRRRFRLPCALRRCSSRRPLKVHVYRSACDVWVNDSSRLFKRSSAMANSAAPWCRHARILPHRGAAMHISAAIVATATLSIAVRSATLLFTTAFKVHVYRSACDVWVNDSSRLFKRSSATANSAAPWCRHARTLSWQRRRFRLPCILRRCSSQRPFIFLGSRVMSDVPMILRGLFEVSSATANSAAPWCRHAHICCRRGNGDAFDCRALCDAALHDGLYKSSR
jgi:hypothetical protein